MTHDVILNLLHNLGDRREVDRYVREHAEVGSCTLVKVGGALIENDLDELGASIALLSRVGLSPVVVHGAGQQLTRELDARQIQSEWVDGFRVTTSETINAAQRVFHREGARLADAIDRHGGRARPMGSGVFCAEHDPGNALGLVGAVSDVNTEMIKSALRSGYTPVLSPLGATASGQILNINADTAACALAEQLRPHKTVFLTETGGLLDTRGKVIPAINVPDDMTQLIDSGAVTGGMARKIREIANLLDLLPSHSSISITSPAQAAQELFTHRGSGTLVRKGVQFRECRGMGSVDPVRLRGLVESSFGKALRDSWINSLGSARILLSEDYSAVAVVLDDGPAPYLDKFAVTEQARGAGVGASLWSRLVASTPQLFWRSRTENPASAWYLPRAEGMHRMGEWFVFWRGLGDWASIQDCIEYARGREQSFGVSDTPAKELIHG